MTAWSFCYRVSYSNNCKAWKARSKSGHLPDYIQTCPSGVNDRKLARQVTLLVSKEKSMRKKNKELTERVLPQIQAEAAAAGNI